MEPYFERHGTGHYWWLLKITVYINTFWKRAMESCNVVFKKEVIYHSSYKILQLKTLNIRLKAHKVMQQGCFFFRYYLATSTTNLAQIFTGLLFYAFVGIHQVRLLVFDTYQTCPLSSTFKCFDAVFVTATQEVNSFRQSWIPSVCHDFHSLNSVHKIWIWPHLHLALYSRLKIRLLLRKKKQRKKLNKKGAKK